MWAGERDAQALPEVRVWAANAELAGRVGRRLVSAGARVLPSTFGEPNQARTPDAELVVVDGAEAEQLSKLPGGAVQVCLQNARPDAFEATEANLRAFVLGLGAGTDPTTVDLGAPPSMEVLLEALDVGAVVVEDGDRAVACDQRAAELGALREGRLAFEAPKRGARKICSLGDRAVTVRCSGLQWGRRNLRLLRLEPIAEAGLESHLAHTERLAAVGALAASFAHEVNNPAQSVTFDLHALADRIDRLDREIATLVPDSADVLRLGTQTAELRDILVGSFESMGRIASIVRDMKDFVRVSEDRMEAISANELVNQACKMAHNRIRHGARLVKCCTTDARVNGDRTRLVQILMNLLVNASQAIGEDRSDGLISVSTRVDGPEVVLSVSDNGPGIPDEVLGRLFEPFFTTKDRGEGSGLGLAIALDIARAHGGTLEVETERGRGTRFELRLPVAAARPRAATPARPKLAPRVEGARLLLVDDEPGILRSLGRVLARRYRVETCSDGHEALALLERDPRFDVVLCDLQMPGLDGPELHARLRTLQPELARRMVFMSGGAFTQRAQRFVAEGGFEIVPKPATLIQLDDAICRALATGGVEPASDTADRTVDSSLACPPA